MKHYFVLLEEEGRPTLKIYTKSTPRTKGNQLVLKAKLSRNQLLNLSADMTRMVSRLCHE